MNVPLIDLKKQYEAVKDEVDEVLKNVLDSSKYILGPNVEKFEESIAEYIGVSHAIGVASGTDALVLVLEALEVGAGDEVITSPYTFFATAEAISRVGAKPVFVDVDQETYNIQPELIEEKINSSTKAIIPVHIFGQPADMEPIMELAQSYNLAVVEDACQAIGAKYMDRQVGSFGDAACFSFFPTKNLGTYGDGGMVVTNHHRLADRIRMLRTHGSKRKYFNSTIGYNSRLDEIHAAVLNVKLKYLNQWNERRRQAASRYNRLLNDYDVVRPYVSPVVEHVYHLYILQTDERDRLIKHLRNSGIGTGIYYPVPLHLQEAYGDLNYNEGDLPTAESLCRKALAIPMYPELALEDQLCVVNRIKEFFN